MGSPQVFQEESLLDCLKLSPNQTLLLEKQEGMLVSRHQETGEFLALYLNGSVAVTLETRKEFF